MAVEICDDDAFTFAMDARSERPGQEAFIRDRPGEARVADQRQSLVADRGLRRPEPTRRPAEAAGV